MLRHLTVFAMLPLIASCVAPRAPSPAPTPARPAATPRPAPAAPSERFAGDWSSAPLTPGAWRYSLNGGTSLAMFGAGDAATLIMRCTSGQVSIARSGAVPADMAVAINIRTSFAERQLPIRVIAGLDTMVGATLPATDPLFDQIIYSRGRFVVEATRMAPLVVPTRPEIARVVEDCRG